MSSSSPSYWCYRCDRFTRVLNQGAISCPDCNGGFVEQIVNPILYRSSSPSDGRRRRFPAAAAMHIFGNRAADPDPDPAPRRTRRNGGDRLPFNPVIVVRNHPDGSPNVEGGAGRGGFELYYDDGGGSGLRLLPPSMSEFLLGSGFDRLLDQVTHIESDVLRRSEHPPASKAAIESMPTIEITETHLNTDLHSQCAVCKEEFELRSEAREMPCKHLYHSDCILPWLSLRNSCPVCRHEMQTARHQLDPGASVDSAGGGGDQLRGQNGEEEAAGLTIWRLPGGGFAVGRFLGGRGGGVSGEMGLPVVYTEVDGGFNNESGAPRRIAWGTARGDGGRRSGAVSRMFRNLLGCFFRSGSSSASSSTSSSDSRRSRSMMMFAQGGREA